jgi:hypothetical protein
MRCPKYSVPYALSIAERSAWATNADIPLDECSNCGRIWPESDYIRLWEKYQVEGKKQSKHHNGKVFEG